MRIDDEEGGVVSTAAEATKSLGPLLLRRHDVDWVSLAFGAIFATVGIAFLLGDLDVSDLSTPLVVAASLAMVGVISLALALRRSRP